LTNNNAFNVSTRRNFDGTVYAFPYRTTYRQMSESSHRTPRVVSGEVYDLNAKPIFPAVVQHLAARSAHFATPKQ
jgi:hypothetical protein